MADPAGAEAAGQPTQEELQAYVEQMRQAEPAEIVAQAFQILAMGAEVKLGRSDARVLIDALAAVVEATGDRVPEELTTGMRGAVGQLQAAQVQSERAANAGQAVDEAPSGARAPGRTAAGQSAQQGAQPGQAADPSGQQGSGEGGGENLTNRLWIPGR